jgi:hypothetical protein
MIHLSVDCRLFDTGYLYQVFRLLLHMSLRNSSKHILTLPPQNVSLSKLL